MSDDILARIQAVLDGTCAYDGKVLRPDGPSDVYCDDECQLRAMEAQSRQATEVYYRRDAAPYPRGPMYWRPELVAQDPPQDLEPVADPPAGLTYRARRTADTLALPLNGTVHRRRSTGVYHFQLDDGHRYVGRDVPEATLAAATDGVEAEAARQWQTLERELTDRRRVDESAQPSAGPGAPVSFPYVHLDDPVFSYHATTMRMQARQRYAAVRDEVYVMNDVGRWQPLGHTTDGGVRRSEPARMGFRPARRWCVNCGGAHPPVAFCDLCGCCGARLPATRYEVRLADDGSDRCDLTLDCGEETHRAVWVPRADVGETFALMEEAAVQRLRAATGRTGRCTDPRLVPGEPAMHARLRRWAERLATDGFRRLLADLAAPSRPAPDEHPMQAEIRRRRQQQGHTGPRERRRAPRRIDPAGGAR